MKIIIMMILMMNNNVITFPPPSMIPNRCISCNFVIRKFCKYIL